MPPAGPALSTALAPSANVWVWLHHASSQAGALCTSAEMSGSAHSVGHGSARPTAYSSWEVAPRAGLQPLLLRRHTAQRTPRLLPRCAMLRHRTMPWPSTLLKSACTGAVHCSVAVGCPPLGSPLWPVRCSGPARCSDTARFSGVAQTLLGRCRRRSPCGRQLDSALATPSATPAWDAPAPFPAILPLCGGSVRGPQGLASLADGYPIGDVGQ